MTTLELAAVSPAFQGVYDSAREYKRYQTTRFNNSMFEASQNVPAGISPTNGAFWTLMLQGAPPGALPPLSKADHGSAVFDKTGEQTINLKAGTAVELNGEVHEYGSATPVVMVTPMVPGTDYAVFVCDDGSVRAADADDAAPGSYQPGQCRRIGGFHYGLANLNIDAVPNINAFSIWDLLWRPACPDPRGMALVAGRLWADIYLLGVEHYTLGTSRAGQAVAHGSSPPKVPAMFGGNGTTDYGSLSWFQANEIMWSWGKRLPSYDEFIVMAYGVTEQTTAGSAQATTAHLAGLVSAWGLEQIAGVIWQWGADFGGPDSGASWQATTNGRGSVLNQPNAPLFGGSHDISGQNGSRAATWTSQPSNTSSGFGARGVTEHLRL